MGGLSSGCVTVGLEMLGIRLFLPTEEAGTISSNTQELLRVHSIWLCCFAGSPFAVWAAARQPDRRSHQVVFPTHSLQLAVPSGEGWFSNHRHFCLLHAHVAWWGCSETGILGMGSVCWGHGLMWMGYPLVFLDLLSTREFIGRIQMSYPPAQGINICTSLVLEE